MLERQAVGIARAKLEGKYSGRKTTATADDKAAEVKKYIERGLSVTEAAKLAGISRASAYRINSSKA